MYEYRAKLIRVVDADTLDLEVDLGLRIKHELRVRLAAVDAPERFTPEGKLATQFAKDFLGSKSLIIMTEKDKTEKYGRYLAYVRVEGSDWSLNNALIEAGHVKRVVE